MKVSPGTDPKPSVMHDWSSALPVEEKQPLISSGAANQPAISGFSTRTLNSSNSSIPEADTGQSGRAGSRVKRYLEEPERGINESFPDFQRRHHDWRTGGFGKMPDNEGVTPARPWWQTAGEIVLSLFTAPGIGEGEGVLPKVPAGEIEAVPSQAARPPEGPLAPEGAPATRVDPLPEMPSTSQSSMPTDGSGAAEVRPVDWSEYMKEDSALSTAKSDEALKRQESLYQDAGIRTSDGSDSESSSGSPNDIDSPDHDLVVLYTQDSNEAFNNRFRYDGEAGEVQDPELIGPLADTIESLPKTEGVTLYRGGSGGRGTSGENFRSGEIKVGDGLVNTDFTSFTENPYSAKDFFGDNASRRPGGYTYDDSSVVFILEEPKDARAIAPISVTPSESESVYTPGHVFTVKEVNTTQVNGHPLVQVFLAEDAGGSASAKMFDLRTGKPFERRVMVDRIGPDYAERFFPAPRFPSVTH